MADNTTDAHVRQPAPLSDFERLRYPGEPSRFVMAVVAVLCALAVLVFFLAKFDLAVAATLGPTRVTLELEGDVIVASTLVIDPNGPSPHESRRFSWPLRRLKARVRGRRISRQVIDLPAAGGV